MTQEEKQLLLKDLSARLPYGVIIQFDNGNICETREMGLGSLHDFIFNDVIIKPYLRPISSMTEEEKTELKNISEKYLDEWSASKDKWKTNALSIAKQAIFYNSHHLDWIGLIEKDLALEAPEDMYK